MEVEEWEIWNEERKATKFKERTKKLVSQRFPKYIYVFGKNMSERMPIKKV